MTTKAYQKLEASFSEIIDLDRVIELLNWDQSVKMPASGATARAKQRSTMVKIKHQKLTAEDIPDLLNEAELHKENLSDWEQANLHEMRRYYNEASALPSDLLQALTYKAAECHTIWETARIDDDFQAIAPTFEELISLTKEKAAILSETSSSNLLYDALLDQFDAGSTYADIQPIFDELSVWLPNFLQNVLDNQQETIKLDRNIPADKQQELATWLLDKMGYHGRFDTSSHPFSIGRIGDVRITTRYHEDNFINYAVLCVMHEGGHGLYDMQLPKKWQSQPVGGALDISMAVHESQSMVWEMQIGHTQEFWNFITPKCSKVFEIDNDNPAWSAENLCATSNLVKADFIRVDADEVTYPLHILLRTKLEKALIEGNLSVKDLPDAWNDEMQKSLGIIPPTNRLGCLQDPHWYLGDFGYFPAYLLGAMNAAQIFDAMSHDIQGFNSKIENGDFNHVKEWLKINVHQHGCLHSPKELIKVATGKSLQVDIYKKHLTTRYLKA